MLDSIDADKLAEWQAFDRLQKEAQDRETLQAKALAGVQNNKKRKGR